MSSVVPLNPRRYSAYGGSIFFWIRETDERGLPVDQRFAEEAYRKAQDLRKYRATELRDEAVRAELVEAAVYRASRASKEEPLRDVAGYLFRTFAHLVDEKIARERRVELRSEGRLDSMAEPRRAYSGHEIERNVLTRELLDAMDSETRWVWECRLCGYDLEEIAADLNVSADCLSTRLRRGIKETIQKLTRRTE